MNFMPSNFKTVIAQILRERAESTGFSFGPAVAIWDESKLQLTLPGGEIELADSLEAAKTTMEQRVGAYPFFIVSVGEVSSR